MQTSSLPDTFNYYLEDQYKTVHKYDLEGLVDV